MAPLKRSESALSIDPSLTVRRRSRSSWWVFVPILILILLAIGWSGFWWYAAGKAEQVWNDVVAREAERGVVIVCKDHGFSGYPFRFEARCSAPSIEVTRDDRKTVVRATAFRLVTQIYQPNKLIVEADGPLSLSRPDEGRSVEAKWTSAEASLAVWTDGPQDLRLVVEGLDATATLDGEQRPLVQNGHVEAYARRAVGANAAPGSFDLNSTLTAQALPEVDKVLGDAVPVKATFDGLISGLLDWHPKPGPQFLEEWAAANGVLHIDGARLDRGPTSLIVSGDLNVDTDGKANGKNLAVTIAGVPELAQTIRNTGMAPANLANFLGVGLTLAGKPANIDGKPAVEVPVNLKAGKVSVASIPLASLPRLFEPQ